MTYFSFLFQFLLVPLALLALLLERDRRRKLALPAHLHNLPGWAVVLLHVFIAVLYTTPWDNYLVATRVWWYDPTLVSGLTLGWVPIEEYTFFVLQTLLTGLWLLWLGRRLPRADRWSASGRIRLGAVFVAMLLWLPTPILLIGRVAPATYLALILIWALPPMALQLAFGADILWRYRCLVTTVILVPTFYLATADALAIRAGIWTISPEQSLGVHLLGGLPLEEAIFFLVTNTLIGFGITLAMAEESGTRLSSWLRRWRAR
ncbi:MAG: lycopene cyclase domain-containing protein [Anaerolineae bacterium]|nr:lycopene cyclase domain-containing protein [Anaerolineae bacterium]MDW8098426.1 lycopene cyclase domain-containing protein [Anaerolineae bacterium]